MWEEIADVAVVGAGPAGSASALRVLQLCPDARVLLLDAAAFPRDKTCGDGVAAPEGSARREWVVTAYDAQLAGDAGGEPRDN